jgi:hypothetical protein
MSQSTGVYCDVCRSGKGDASDLECKTIDGWFIFLCSICRATPPSSEKVLQIVTQQKTIQVVTKYTCYKCGRVYEPAVQGHGPQGKVGPDLNTYCPSCYSKVSKKFEIKMGPVCQTCNKYYVIDRRTDSCLPCKDRGRSKEVKCKHCGSTSFRDGWNSKLICYVCRRPLEGYLRI